MEKHLTVMEDYGKMAIINDKRVIGNRVIYGDAINRWVSFIG